LLQLVDAFYVMFRSPCRIQTPSRPVSCTGGWVQIAQSFPTFLWPCTLSAFRQMSMYPKLYLTISTKYFL